MFLELYHNYQKLDKTDLSTDKSIKIKSIEKHSVENHWVINQSINKDRITDVQNNTDEFQMNYVKEKKVHSKNRFCDSLHITFL